MAESKKISELPVAANVSDLDMIPTVPGGTGTTSSVTILKVKNHILSASTFLNRAGIGGGGTLDPFASVGNDAGAAVEKVLGTYTLPGGTLHTNGMGLHIQAIYLTANNANSKTVTIYLGSQDTYVKGAVSTNQVFIIDVYIYRYSATQFVFRFAALAGNSGTNNFETTNSQLYGIGEGDIRTTDFAADQTITIKGVNGVANDILKKEFVIKLM